MSHFVAIKKNGFDTVTNQVNPFRAHMHLILASIFVWFKAEPEFPVFSFSARWIVGQRAVWPFSTWRQKQLIEAAAKTDIEQQNTQSERMASIEHAHYGSMHCQLMHEMSDDWLTDD